MQNVIKTALCIVALCTFVEAKETEVPDVDHLALASMMVYDGKFDKAYAELAEAKNTDKNLDMSKYYTIKSVIAMREQNHALAIDELKKAVEATKAKVYKAPEAPKEKRKHLFSVASEPEVKPVSTEPPFDGEKIRHEELQKLYSHLSQESYKAERYLDTIKYLDLQGAAGRDEAAEYMLRADCYWKANDKAAAVDILSKGAKAFGSDQSLLKQKFYYYTELGLYQEAIVSAKAYMKRAAPNAKEYMALAQMLIAAGQREEAITLLEETKMLFPTEGQVNLLLGHLYMKNGMEFTTAGLFEEASYYEHKYVKEAAEVYRRVGLTPHALYLNSQITDKVEKLKQKIAIYVDREEYENIIGLIDALERYKMLDDDNIRYAVAYAYYMAKDYEEAEKQLKLITDDELFSKATIIRKNIEKCQNDSMECI
ncbi:MAG: tetratricopeptide repeat protein [Sulfurovum sp.]